MKGEQEQAAQADLLRELIDPFEISQVEPAWRTPTVLAIARSVYEARDFQVLPVLGDALEDAGCDLAELLAHLRGGGDHVRGCWALDLR